MGVNRELQPRTPGFSAVNEPSEPTAYPMALADTGDQPKKKRGRPSKAELEIKVAEYAAQGKPYPPPRKQKPPRPPSEDTRTTGPTAITFTPVTVGPSDTVAASSGKKRTPKPKIPKNERNLALEATATAAQQFQVESGSATRLSVTESSDLAKRSEALPAFIGPTERDEAVQQGPLESPQHQDEQAPRIHEQSTREMGPTSRTDDSSTGVGITTQEQPTIEQEPFGTGNQDAKQD